MLIPKNIKKGDLLYRGIAIYKVLDNNLENEWVTLKRYRLDLTLAEIHSEKPKNVNYYEFGLPGSLKDLVKLDEDGMQGYIIGIFEREE
jgi:hypothetical protein